MAKKKDSARKKQARRKRASARRRRQQQAVWLWGGGIALILAALVFMARAGSSCGVSDMARQGAPLANFTLKDIDGKTVHLDDYQGQTVLINFWATWCPPCRAEMPALKAYYEAHQDEGFVILAVNAQEGLSQVRQFAYDYQLPFPVLLDETACAVSGYGVQSFPTSIVIGPDGVVRKIHIGMLDPATLESEVTPILRGE